MQLKLKIRMKNNQKKFLFFLFILLVFQAWMTTIKTGQFMFGDFPEAGSNGLIIDNGNIMNSRTGTIVIGSEVRLLPAAITHGGLTVTISENQQVAQPNAFADGETVVTTQSIVHVDLADIKILFLAILVPSASTSHQME